MTPSTMTTGPYLVRVLGTPASEFSSAAWEVVRERAAATVEAMRDEAGRLVDWCEPFGGAPYGEWADARWRARALPAEGDKLRLPDGRWLFVEPTTGEALYWATPADARPLPVDTLTQGLPVILAAFNVYASGEGR